MLDATQGWNRQEPSISSNPQDDFQQYLDLGMNALDGLNFDFQDFSGEQNGQIMRDTGEEMDTSIDAGVAMLGTKETMMQEHRQPMAPAPLDLESSSDNILDLDAQIQFLQQQRHQAQRQLEEQQRQFYLQQGSMVPPTPNSIEMHSNNHHFYQQSTPQQQTMYEQYNMQMKEAEMAFTPLVSPAVTPLDAHFNIPEYTIPGAYFSPLSSPALHAQNENRPVYETRMSVLSTSASPADMEMDEAGASSNAHKQSKKAPKQKAPRSVRQSPIVKPQRRKRGSTSMVSAQGLANIIEPSAQQQQQQLQDSIHGQEAARSGPSTVSSGSGAESISPEHLSDTSMAPPPLPQPVSARNSPFLASQTEHSRVKQLGQPGSMSPATPASLMRLAKSPQASPALSRLSENEDQPMEGFLLPEAANPARTQFSRLDTQSDGQTTPTLDGTARTPGHAPLPSPAFHPPQGAQSSPRILSQSSTAASSSASTPSFRKTPQLAGRGTKKRQSVSGVQASPALLPRISPSIKPLIRGAMSSSGSANSVNSISDDTASLLLASKSNYQNILEGTHLPGVSYPSELSTNLTSKRTSHKLAEQGRRNRINSALQEMATLLPKWEGKDGVSSGCGSGDKEDEDKQKQDGKNNAAQSANSKASTVELAIDYIKQLKREVEDANKRAEEAEKKLQGQMEKMAASPPQENLEAVES